MDKLKVIVCLALLLSGCAFTKVETYHAAGQATLCNGKNPGIIAVLPEAAWRTDQKEPQQREQMAFDELQKVFQSIPCGSTGPPGGIQKFSNWSAMPEAQLLAQFAQAGVDTIIILRLEELTPKLHITFSLPFLWVGTNEADFRIRTLSTATGAVLSDMRVKRVTGGAFNIRPAEWSGAELHGALHTILSDGPDE